MRLNTLWKFIILILQKIKLHYKIVRNINETSHNKKRQQKIKIIIEKILRKKLKYNIDSIFNRNNSQQRQFNIKKWWIINQKKYI